MTLHNKFHIFATKSTNTQIAFDKMAQYVFNKCCLKAHGKTYYFTEIEFYYYADAHPDTYTYGKAKGDQHSPQLTSDQCYLHSSGLDITFGADKEYGGILVRGIRNEKNEYIFGPINCAKTILGSIRYSSKRRKERATLPRLEKKENGSYSYLGIGNPNHIYKGPRIGLKEKNDFRWAPYRYIVDFTPTHQFKEKEIVFAVSVISSDNLRKKPILAGYNYGKIICRLKKNKPELYKNFWKEAKETVK